MLRLTHLTSLLRLARWGLFAAMPLAIVACGDQTSNTAPIIDSVDAPLVVTEQNGAYAIPVTVLFHDNDGEAITRIHYRLPPNVDAMIDVPAANPNLESAQLTIVIKASDLDGTPANDVAVKGQNEADDAHVGQAPADRTVGHATDKNRARSLELRIVDGRGIESRPLSSTVTLD